MLNQSNPIEKVFSSPLLISKILSNLRYDHLKESRRVNKLWRFEATKLLRSQTRVCVNESNLECMLYSETILGLSLHLRWSYHLSPPMKRLIQKYSRYIKCLSWFLDETGLSTFHCGSDSCNGLSPFYHNELCNLSFPCLTEIYLVISIDSSHLRDIATTVGNVLSLSPELQTMRIECVNPVYRFTKISRILRRIAGANLGRLHLSGFVNLSEKDIGWISSMRGKLSSFVWEGVGGEEWEGEAAIYLDKLISKGAWLGHLQECTLPFTIPLKPLPLLKKLTISQLRYPPPLPLATQFPHLEELTFSFMPNFEWEAWIPSNMPCMATLKSLSWAKKTPFTPSSAQCFLRLFEKLPNLISLSCPANDRFLEQIFLYLPQLKRLELRGVCGDFGITGIHQMYLAEIKKKLEIAGGIKNKAQLLSYRQRPNICDLIELEELTLLYTKATDFTVNYAVSLMTSLKKVYITGISLNAVMELIENLKLVELGVPQPLEGKLLHEDIVILKGNAAGVKIVAGWDWIDFGKTLEPCF